MKNKIYDPDEAFAFYADYIYDSYPEGWDAELERQSRQIRLEADVRQGWIIPRNEGNDSNNS